MSNSLCRLGLSVSSPPDALITCATVLSASPFSGPFLLACRYETTYPAVGIFKRLLMRGTSLFFCIIRGRSRPSECCALRGDRRTDVKMASAFLLTTGILGMLAAPALSQAPPSAGAAKTVSRTTKAVNYRRAGAARIDFQGTELMQQAGGEARVQNKGSRTEIEAKFIGLDEATKFGLEYLTYVLWAVSPGGRAVNLGEVVLKNGAGEVKAISDMQTFGMIVTAEPYFAVTQPGNTVVLENVFGPATLGKVENIDASYELLGRGIYSSSNTKIENAIFGIDRKTPLE